MGTSDVPPGPDGLPMIGSAFEVIGGLFDFGIRCAEEYGDVVHTEVLGRDFYLLSHPDHIERVLVSEQDSFSRSDHQKSLLENFAPDSLFVSDGEAWQRQRQQFQSRFYRDEIDQYAEDMGRTIEEVVTGWPTGEAITATEENRNLTLRVLTETMFGEGVREHTDEIRSATDSVREKFDSNSISMFLPDWIPTRRNRRFRKAADSFEELLRELLEERRTNPEAHDDMLAEMIDQVGPHLDDDEIVDNLKGFLIGGHDTTAAGLTCAIGLLALNPDVQRRIHDEVASLDVRPPFGRAALRELTYTEAVFRECLRLYTPITSILRETTEPVDFDGYTVPAGSEIALVPWIVHRDDRWWDDPEEFEPDRWLENGALTEGDRPDYAYFPFGGGPFQCIGMRFATAELVLNLATICYHHEIETDRTEMPEISGGMANTPKSPIQFRVYPREK